MTTWMNRIAVAAVAATLGTAAITTQAQPQRRGHAPEARHDNRNLRPGQHHNRPVARPAQRRPPVVVQHRGAGPDHRWYKGSRVPPQYRGHNYVVNNWRVHHLSAPPRGYHWIQNGGDYLLVAIASGVITQVILNN